MLPAWAHGFVTRSLAFNDPDVVSAAYDSYLANGFPIQGVSLPDATLGGYYNFKFNPLVADL